MELRRSPAHQPFANPDMPQLLLRCSVLLLVWIVVPWNLPAQTELDVSTAQSIPAETTASNQTGNDDLDRLLSDLRQRLEAVEQENQELRAQRGGAAADATHEVSLLSAMQDRLTQVQDPSITTVDQQTHKTGVAKSEAKAKKWYDRLSIRGYAQFRYNFTVQEEADSAPAQHVGDRSVGANQNFLIRRARVIISGDVSDHMYVYLQPDFASSVPGSPDANQFAQIRDWYGDLYVDEDKEYRFRIGQSKIPYGWENLQSSSNRIALDRSDSLNSAVRNERDLGLFFYWTPESAQDLFKEVLDEGLKGSGNYGVFGLGVYNGQGGSFSEQNENLHVVSRLTYPYKMWDGQIVEFGVQGYTGKYTVLSSPIQPLGLGPVVRPLGTLETDGRPGIRDERIAGTFVWYPQPFGIHAEWNVGRGPSLNDAQTAVVERSVNGGYVMLTYRWETECHGTLFPFAKFNYYRGGHKAERNAPYSEVDEYEVGLEWQFNPQMELVTQYTITDRTNTTALTSGESYRQFEGQLLRTQFQINY